MKDLSLISSTSGVVPASYVWLADCADILEMGFLLPRCHQGELSSVCVCVCGLCDQLDNVLCKMCGSIQKHLFHASYMYLWIYEYLSAPPTPPTLPSFPAHTQSPNLLITLIYMFLKFTSTSPDGKTEFSVFGPTSSVATIQVTMVAFLYWVHVHVYKCGRLMNTVPSCTYCMLDIWD